MGVRFVRFCFDNDVGYVIAVAQQVNEQIVNEMVEMRSPIKRIPAFPIGKYFKIIVGDSGETEWVYTSECRVSFMVGGARGVSLQRCNNDVVVRIAKWNIKSHVAHTFGWIKYA